MMGVTCFMMHVEFAMEMVQSCDNETSSDVLMKTRTTTTVKPQQMTVAVSTMKSVLGFIRRRVYHNSRSHDTSRCIRYYM